MSPARGRLLLASPLMLDPCFHQSVVLLSAHDESGSFGHIINRRTAHTLERALGQLCPDPLKQRPLYWGGPVQPEALFALHDGSVALGGLEILPGLFLGAETELLDHWVFDGREVPCQFISGYAGWSAGQLEREMEEGSWIVRNASAASILSGDPTLWERFMSSHSAPVALN